MNVGLVSQEALASFEAHEWQAKLEEAGATSCPAMMSPRCSQGLEAEAEELEEHLEVAEHLHVQLLGARFTSLANEEVTISYRLDSTDEP